MWELSRDNNGMGHPNLIQFHHYFDEPKRYLIIQEVCEQGNLHQILEMMSKQDEKDRVTIASFIIRQLLSAVNYMHKRGFCHRDLKLENVLVHSISGKFVDTRVIDFGESADLRPTDEKGYTKKWNFESDEDYAILNTMNDFRGTVAYMAPEIVNAHIKH